MNLADIDNIEDGTETEFEFYESIQKVINSGTGWSFQGSYGRMMMDAIKSGYCMLGRQMARDYYGNKIPSRTEVQAGTAGSYEYVANLQGAEYADTIGEIA